MTANSLERTHNPAHGVLPLLPPIRLQHLLAPTDFSEASNVGVTYAVKLARKLGATLTLAYVLEPVPPLPGVEALLLPNEWQIASEAAARLKTLARRHTHKNLRLTTSLLDGKASHAIVVAAAEHATELIVLATHGYTGLDHLVLGSTAEQVARHAPCSVLIVRARSGPPPETLAQPLKLTRLLVPIDFSDLSQFALPWAAFLARSFGAEIVFFHAVEKYPLDYLMGPELMNQAITPLLEHAEQSLDDLAHDLHRTTGIKTSVLVRDGTPYKEICQAAQDAHADLVALTTHGYTGLKHIWLGSTAERVARHAPCPVLIVRPPKAPAFQIPGWREGPEEL